MNDMKAFEAWGLFQSISMRHPFMYSGPPMDYRWMIIKQKYDDKVLSSFCVD
jgi:hypothetical protein